MEAKESTMGRFFSPKIRESFRLLVVLLTQKSMVIKCLVLRKPHQAKEGVVAVEQSQQDTSLELYRELRRLRDKSDLSKKERIKILHRISEQVALDESVDWLLMYECIEIASDYLSLSKDEYVFFEQLKQRLFSKIEADVEVLNLVQQSLRN